MYSSWVPRAAPLTYVRYDVHTRLQCLARLVGHMRSSLRLTPAVGRDATRRAELLNIYLRPLILPSPAVALAAGSLVLSCAMVGEESYNDGQHGGVFMNQISALDLMVASSCKTGFSIVG